MSKKQKGGYIQIAGFVLFFANLSGSLGEIVPYLGLGIFLYGGYLYRVGRSEEKKLKKEKVAD